MVRLTKARLAELAGPGVTLRAATLEAAPEGNTVTSNIAFEAELVTDVAVIVTDVLLATVDGATYVAAVLVWLVSEPTVVGESDHVTPLLSLVAAVMLSCCA